MKGSAYFDYKAECDVCGFVYEARELKKRWDGLMVCKHDWEPRHPLDFFRVRNDVHKLPFTRERKISYRCYATLSADVTPATGAWTLLGLNTELADRYNEFTTGTSTFRPTSTESRELRFGVTATSISGESSLRVALYKNGSPLKVLNPVTSWGETTLKNAAVYTDSSATSSDDYTVRYFITGSAVTIEAFDSGTYLEVK